MLKIFNILKKKNYNVDWYIKIKNNKAGIPRHYPPANKEWFNSIYAYNLNTIKLLPTMDKVILKFIKSYFNLYSRKLEKKVRFNKFRIRFKRFRRLSTNRILISKAELKHTSDKVIITLYIYNRQKKYYLNKLKKILTLDLLKKKSFIDKLYIIKKKGLKIIKKVRQEKKILFINCNNNKNYEKNYEIKYLKIFFKKCLYKEILSIYYYQIISLNESKFKHNYILPLTNLIETFYNKKVDFNLVNLKYLYLNSYILTETIVTKLRNRKNKLIWVLKNSLLKFTVPSIDLLAMYNEMYNKKKKIQNLKVSDFYLFNNENNNILKANSNDDTLDFILYKMYTYKEKEKLFFKNLQLVNNNNNNNNNHNDNDMVTDVTNTVLSFIKHKFVKGIRLEGAGRLTRRYKAEKSIYKVRYIGNLKNTDSSFKGLSSVLLRGHAKSNLQHTKLKSKIRIGSFGIKGWVSSN